MIEIMVVVAVILLLLAITLPALGRAKKAAKGSADLSSLRQLGLAGALYKEQAEADPSGTFEIIETGLAPKDICSGLGDPVPEGLANRVARQINQRLGGRTKVAPVNYRNSFVGWRETGIVPESLNRADVGAIGWLIDDSRTEGTAPDNALAGRKGPYFRLLRDTSVINRQHLSVTVESKGHQVVCEADLFLFADFSIEEMTKYCKERF